MSAFENAYIERCNKETETMIASESSVFLQESITYLQEHRNEFIYMESNVFEEIGIEGISLEMDDVFGTYDVMLGLKLQKKFEMPLKEHLNTHLHGDESKFDLMFSHEDGLWDLNFALNYVEGFGENISFSEAFEIIYRFLSKLVADVKA
jgi:hypothetical protein